MVEYKCEKCKKIFKKKYDYNNHIERITPCDKPLNVCVYCGVKYATKANVSRHIKTNCSVFLERETEKKHIFDELLKLKQENKTYANEINELKMELIKRNQSGGGVKMPNEIDTPNNIHNGNIHNGNIHNGNIHNGDIHNGDIHNGGGNNITVVAFGLENMDTINKKSILEAVSVGINSAVKLTKNVHFNPNNPEYHNVYIPSMNNGCAMIYDGSKWKLAPRKEVINDLYRDKRDYVEEQMDTFKKSLSEYRMNQLEEWLALGDGDNASIRKIKQKIGLLLYNERNIPLASKK